MGCSMGCDCVIGLWDVQWGVICCRVIGCAMGFDCVVGLWAVLCGVIVL